ncbi:MAG: hypothetical protein ACFCUU_19175 [Cyclobacteriaceae bacterium]
MIYDKTHQISIPEYFGFGFADHGTLRIENGETFVGYFMNGIKVHELNVNGLTSLTDCFGNTNIQRIEGATTTEVFTSAIANWEAGDPRINYIHTQLNEIGHYESLFPQQALPSHIILPAGILVRFSVPVLRGFAEEAEIFKNTVKANAEIRLHFDSITEGQIVKSESIGELENVVPVVFHHYTGTLARVLQQAKIIDSFLPWVRMQNLKSVVGFGGVPVSSKNYTFSDNGEHIKSICMKKHARKM